MYILTHTKQPDTQTALWDWQQEIDLTKPTINTKMVIQYTYTTVPNQNEAAILQPKIQKNKDYLKTMLFTTPFQALQGLDPDTQYYEFNIPKSSGGVRTITAPSPILKKAQKSIVQGLQHLNLYPHNAVHSYMPGRGIQSALQIHQQNESKWFLKLDIKNFFPSITGLLLQQNLIIYANYAMLVNLTNLSFNEQDNFYKILCYKNALPQGSPASPYLSNLVLFNFDCWLTNVLQGYGRSIVYTRYADDLLISAPEAFTDLKTCLIDTIELYLKQDYKMLLNKDKIRYGTSSGKNWNLGLMLNKDNNITIGHKKKQRLKIAINNLYRAHLAETVNQKQAYKVFGQIAHFQHIEPDYAEYVLTKYENKFNISLATLHKKYG